MQRRIEKYGFAFLVFVAIVCAGFLAASTEIPDPVPDYALQAVEVYRLEIGAAFFVAFYLAVMAIILALHGRGFAEFGTKGLKAEAVTAREVQGELEHGVLESLEGASSDLEDIEHRLRAHDRRLQRLEEDSLS